jgi:hypothetical protein
MTNAKFSKVELKRLAEGLRDQICNHAGDRSSRASWTEAVQKTLDDYRKEQRWERSELLPPITSDPLPASWKKDSFLLDFVIWRRDMNGREGAWLASESEWELKDDAVIKDFEKLLSFKAPLKLMIHDVKKHRP